MRNSDLVNRDLSVLWHPCTQMKDHEFLPMIPIKRGKGIWLEDFDNNRYLDAISSWWVNLFGHANPLISQAIKTQVDQLEHVILAGFSHAPVISLSEKLIQLCSEHLHSDSPKLSRCFYADSGSAAVEIALKMSFHYWKNQGQAQKTKFITLTNSYHGETLGALAVGDVALYKETYKPLLMHTITVPSPDCYFREATDSWEEHSRKMFVHMEQTLAQHAEEVCAVIIEPLVQCAGSMRMYHPVYLSLLRQACNNYNVHLIADEIAVGFGRTGTFFACEQAQIIPDFLCLAKGLTGGYLPLSVVITHENIYRAFYDDYPNLKAFLHSHSYTGNPLACAAALATLSIFAEDNVIENNKGLSQSMQQATAHFSDHPHVAEVRQQGMIVAIELAKHKHNKAPFPWQERRGLQIYQYALQQGVLLRPLGNVIYFMPPYIITEEQIDLLAQVTWQALLDIRS